MADATNAAEPQLDQVLAKPKGRTSLLEHDVVHVVLRAERAIEAAQKECFERIREVETFYDSRIREALRAAAAAECEAVRLSAALGRADERNEQTTTRLIAQEMANTELTTRLSLVEAQLAELMDRAGGDRVALGDAN